jgi:endonuclease YncB( thermonuclease family)
MSPVRPRLLHTVPRLVLALAAAAIIAPQAGGESRGAIAGPVRAHLVRIIDGDTVEVLARIWPDHYVETRVRLAGIDAPELRGRCAEEIALAERAKARLAALLAGNRLLLADIHYGKFAGRVVARVLTEDGRDVAEILRAENLARPYAGGRRASWCGE